MMNKIDEATRVGRRYWFVDGFTELLGGVLFVLLGGVLLLRGLAPQRPFLAQFATLASDIALIKVLGLLAAALILWWVKDRFTYPRTGFVRGRRVTWAQILSLLRNSVLCLLLPLLALAAALVFLPSPRHIFFTLPAWLPLFISAFWAGLCILSGRWLGLRRFLLLGIMILLAGIGISAWQLAAGLPPIPVEGLPYNLLATLPEVARPLLTETISRAFASIGWLTLIAGVVFAVSGGITFLFYRQENPIPYEEEA